MPILTIIVPAYNEAESIQELLNALHAETCDLDAEIIIVDDGSYDGTFDVCEEFIRSQNSLDGGGGCPQMAVRLLRHVRNQGKTAAIRTGLKAAEGSWTIIQDADLEYDPRDIRKLMMTAKTSDAVIYGWRPPMWNSKGRRLLSTGVLAIDCLLLLLYGRWVRDHATCYKLLPTGLLSELDISGTGFEFCAEVTAKLMQLDVAIMQVPILYAPRTITAGKKLRWTDGIMAAAAVVKQVFRKPRISSEYAHRQLLLACQDIALQFRDDGVDVHNA